MTYKVLLIDDEPSALEGLLLWIDWRELGFEICGTCSNGQEGLRLIHELDPDLVITDVNMPLLNGLEMIGAWQQAGGRETKFVILSGYSEFEYAQTAIRYGINHYLLKPVFPEEATEELREIYRELEQEERGRRFKQMAASEETAAAIKGLLYEQPADPLFLAAMPADLCCWNVCLVQTAPQQYAEVRGKAAALIAGAAAMYLVDLEAGCCAIVSGSSTGGQENDAITGMAASLRQECPGQPVFIAAGTSVPALTGIMESYRTAKEALQHFFYRPASAGVLMYHEIKDTPFSRQYDHIRMADELIGFINTLDLSGFRSAVDSAAHSFQEKLVAPEAVKKFVIHLIYRIREMTHVTESGKRQELPDEFQLPEIYHYRLTLTGLMGYLLTSGETGIELLLQERSRKSPDIVRDINQYIQEHYRESLTIQKLAEIFYLHPVYLGQLLIKKNGMGFNELLHNLRIEEAEKLLHEHKLKLSEVAEHVGYANYGQFLKQFEKKMKMSPNEYRNTKT
ncbi:response regulator [Paenibacillus ihuae]|uniref:response regulator n=1 Tax=Paenibacillus ihuae TaxID=1232431 RepID=UPI0006D55DBF|nr:response regulator [Paenibacillus ihuae]